MKGAQIFLVGAGGHAVSCIDVIEQNGAFVVAGLVSTDAEVGRAVLGYSVIGTDADLASLVERHRNALVAVGHIESHEPRMRLFEQLRKLGCNTPSIVSPSAYVSRHARIGEGVVVMHGAVVNANAVIGNNCIINSNALVEHGVVIGDHCHVSTGVRVNGEARVGWGTFLGSGSVVRERITIAERCTIGMGRLVLADCPSGTRLAGEKSR